MRILFLAHRLPFPPHKGEKIRALNIIKRLLKHHEIFVGCLIDERADVAAVPALKRLVADVRFRRIHRRLKRMCAPVSMLRGRAITVDYFYSGALQRELDALIERERIEAVLCSSSPMAEYVFRSRQRAQLAALPKVMDLIDVDSVKWAQYAARSAPWARTVFRREAARLGAFEQRIAREFERVLVVSESEARCFPGRARPANLAVMGNGVDLDYFRPGRSGRAITRAPAVVFTGVMDYRPNVDGIGWFIERAWPQIARAIPGAQLYVVGSRPDSTVRALARRPGVTVTGFVEDVRDYLSGASVCIAPLRIARGVQNKVLEAMAMGKPVVLTPQAFEGIEAKPPDDLIVADEPRFAPEVIALLRDPQRGERIGRNARAVVESHYAWSARLELLDRLFPPASLPQ
ncbi:MAG TPA: TIGR03087 family PEP-CTERM/XrtA system glycosyltransferase [Steroidobacteraceae bacterium]|nr:TIGR03087 family PEP-CTERM/XrtA system glycosyltransferase [Steroidobacteraceae bacterium]